MVTYAVNMSNVQAVADEMSILAGKIAGMVSELNDQQNLNLADWTGSARDAYTAAQNVWNHAAQDMAIQAQNAQTALSSINNAYANAEYQGLGLWGQ
jgi:WXG100 family type VII secretion target